MIKTSLGSIFPPPPISSPFFLSNFLPLFKGEEYKEGVALRKEIPIPHLSPPPSQREGGGFGREGEGGLGEEAPPLSSSLREGEDTEEGGETKKQI